MRLVWAALAIMACKKNEPAPPPPLPAPVPVPVVPAPGDAAVDAGQPIVDLFRAVPTTVTVSSTVANRSILPRHLVDRDPKTAWNSATGQLVGAWIQIAIPMGWTIDDVRMTAGFTATGPGGEDYFTMNPRIKSVTVTADDKPAGTFPLDIASHDLQTIRVHAEHIVRLTIADIEPGSKPSWLEASVSELEAWGTPPAWWKPPAKPATPTVVVFSDRVFDPCAEIEKARAEFEKAHAHDHYSGPGGEDHAYPPDCVPFDVTGIETLPQPWASGQSWCEIGDEIYGPKDCMVRFAANGEVAMMKVSSESAHGDVQVTKLDRHGDDELAISWSVDDKPLTSTCHAHPLECSEPK